LDREIEESISGVEEEVYKGTGVSSTRLRFKKMRIEVDILDYTTEGILSMECEDER